MVLKEREVSIWGANQKQNPPMRPWRYEEMGGELMGELPPSGPFNVCQSHSYPKYYQRASHQVSRFCSGPHLG